MIFENNAPDWKNQGTEPAEDIKRTGFFAGYKPPASIYNWFWYSVSQCIKELQSKVALLYSSDIDCGCWDDAEPEIVIDGGGYDNVAGEIIDCAGYDNTDGAIIDGGTYPE